MGMRSTLANRDLEMGVHMDVPQAVGYGSVSGTQERELQKSLYVLK